MIRQVTNPRKRPESENDYLEQADEFESSGSKWKAGDPAKALRFYQKAVTAYIEGLSRFPKSFDLAYNKALLLYHITQEKRIAPLVGSLLELLKEALDAHRLALTIDQENPDVLFNTAQVLTSFAEELNENADQDPGFKKQAVSQLQEAVELFAACLTRQEMEYTQLQEIQGAADETPSSNETEKAPPTAKRAESDQGEQWAVVLESITPDTLIETALAQLGSLSSLATVAAPTTSSLLANLSEIAIPIVTQKLPSYISLLPTSVPEDALGNKSTPFLVVSNSSSTFHPDAPAHPTNPQAEAKIEADLAVAVFKSALSSAEYKSKLASSETYASRIKEAFSSLIETTNTETTPLPSSIQILSAYADALIDLADAVTEMDTDLSQNDSATTRWTSLTHAQDLLTKVTTLLSSPGTLSSNDLDLPGRAQIYLQRGDIELLRSRLARLPSATASISNSLPTLLKNAGVYYRGAKGLAGQDGNEQLRDEASIKAGVVKIAEGIWGGGITLATMKENFQGVEADTVRETVDEMAEEGLINEEVRKVILS
ncbi:Sterol 3-beta-glucosyltransferase [Venturia nashicola]|uniref:Sterol 3-beta-glucosyltransferase n=1 Tax=Venturia nashicola TaxID=86259 RepID=A0A4Z1PQN9_9PEZI|nr:Sterol 3-beta-glucosyltransferase [Venturia nashicola]TLD38376.1 Sterol 3-beta-glucosyltransferase [Venturia nashicola]